MLVDCRLMLVRCVGLCDLAEPSVWKKYRQGQRKDEFRAIIELYGRDERTEGRGKEDQSKDSRTTANREVQRGVEEVEGGHVHALMRPQEREG